MPRLKSSLSLALLLLASGQTHADWRDDIGHTRLLATHPGTVPDTITAGITQVEAGNADGNNYLPDPTNAQFTGKSITKRSAGSGTSNHALNVGTLFYGNTGSIMPGTATVQAYNATGWLYGDYLNFDTATAPQAETSDVQNHSWISIFDRTKNTESAIAAAVANINQRLDFAIDRDGFSSAVGVNNGTSSTLPDLLAQSYHTIAVGRVDGQHSAGITAYDGAGRMKPDLVAFATTTSNATPQVAGAAGLLNEKLRADHAATLLTADRPRLVKALLLAGATKEPLAAWSRADTTRPYDAVRGAGALNILLAYRILTAGPFDFSDNATVDSTGWSVANVNSPQPAQSTRRYFFDIPAGSRPAPFSVALTWHRAGSTPANLDLSLHAVAPGTFTVGDQLDASLSTVDNVEHLYQLALAPGRYALVVTRQTGDTTRYALAWRTTPTVNVATAAAIADELTGTPATFTLTRTGPVTTPLLVPLNWGGTAVSGSHYTTPPSAALIPAGQSTATINLHPISDQLAQGDRTVTLTLLTDYALTAGDAPTADATIRDKPYDAWRFARFSPEQLADETISGESADPDHDSRGNLTEYAFASEPLIADTALNAPLHTLDAGRLALTYLEAADRADLTYTVETTTDLTAPWQTGALHLEETARLPTPQGETVTIRRLETAERQFLRLRVER